MPQWGRPPGARPGKPAGGRVAATQRMWENMAGIDVGYGKKPLTVVGRDNPAAAAAAGGGGGEEDGDGTATMGGLTTWGRWME